ncbi:hypothetical protein IAR55_000043 [Kwoniella newhampshirensis]|uniref:Uncharacterized protein n=1 Tax=Kwoniella newhampshirensis TaxID=1651941 RepID=A0AAW0Z5I3_9TREE
MSSAPPLPSSTLTLLLSSLLPPSPLPQELLSKSLLQRLLYLPPSPANLDAHISPFPTDESTQPLSSRLRELARGHTLTEVGYMKEAEEDTFAKVTIGPEELGSNGDDIGEGSVEIWFEFESGSDGRGWVYHSARLPIPNSDQVWVMSPSLLPPSDADHHSQLRAQSSATQDIYSTNDGHESRDVSGQEAPAGYWAAFDSPPKNGGGYDVADQLDDEGEGAEDDYWAQYSRPATAPITPGAATPGVNTIAAGGGGGLRDMSQLNPFSTMTSNGGSIYSHGGQNGVRDGIDEGSNSTGLDTASRLSDSLHQLGLVQALNSAKDCEPRGIWKDDTGRQVRDRLKGKIGNSLKELWTDYLGDKDENGGDQVLEERAMGWLRISRNVVDATTSTINTKGNNVVGNGARLSMSGQQVNGGWKEQVIRAKLEVLKEMYEIVAEQEHDDEAFWRLCEGVVKSQRGVEVEDEDVRQIVYYE